MSRRIDVELTSDRGDGTWSWRAAGARQPKGVVDGALLYTDAQVGDVVRAEADFDIEGITITAVQPPKGAKAVAERIEVIGVEREFSPVTSSLTGKARERAERGEEDRPRRGRDDRGPRPGGRPGGPSREGARGPRPSGERPDRPPRERPAPPAPKPKPKKLRPARVHRDAFLASLAPEQQPIAEQLLRGGMPAVRNALEEQNAKAKAEDGLEIPTDTVLAIAEQLVTRARVADWLDRAEAAKATGDELALRDLRSVVSSADDVARDETTRELAAELKATLEQRSQADQQGWLTDIEQSLAGGRVVRALRLSSRPPEPGTSFPEELSARLVEAANGALTADIAPDRWATVLDAVAYSPVRRTVVPAGIPAEPTEELLAAVRKHAGRTPAIATLFGVEPPPDKAKGAKRPTKAAGRNPNLSRTGGTRGAAVPVPGRPGGPPVPPAKRIPPPPGRQIGATLPGSPPTPRPGAAPTPGAAQTAAAPAEDASAEVAPANDPTAPLPSPSALGTSEPAAPSEEQKSSPQSGAVTSSDQVPSADDVAPTEAPEVTEAALTFDAAPSLTDAPAPDAAVDPLPAPAAEAGASPEVSDITGSDVEEVDALVSQAAEGPFEPPADPPVEAGVASETAPDGPPADAPPPGS